MEVAILVIYGQTNIDKYIGMINPSKTSFLKISLEI